MPLFARSHLELPESPQKAKLALEACLRVSEIAASAAPLPEALKAMVDAAVELLGAEQGSIMLLEERERMLVLVAATGLPATVTRGARVPVGESVAGRVLATGTPLRLGQIDQDAFVNFVPKNRPIASSIVVPLRIGGRAMGVLNLAIVEGALTFTDEDVRVGQMFADQAAGVIHRARLHEQAEHRSQDLMRLLEADDGLLGTLDIDALLQRVLDGGTRLAGSKDGFACLFDPETAALSRGVFRGIDKPTIRSILAKDEVIQALDKVDLAVLTHEQRGPLTAAALRTSKGTRGLLVVAAPVSGRDDLVKAFAQAASAALSASELHSDVERKESELSSIIQGVPNPIVLIDARGRFVAINPAAEELFSISSVFSAGARVEEMLGADEVVKLLQGEGDVQAEVRLGNPERTFKVRVADVRVPGAPIGRVMIMDDVTSERAIIQTQHDFVAMIGHELRTPLTIIKGFARTLMKRVEQATIEEATEALEIIDNRAGQLERLIEDLLYVSGIESREASLRIDDVDIAQLIENVVDDLLEGHADREVVLEVPPEVVWACDETKIGLVIRHLVENALKYSKAPAPVVLRVSKNDDELRVDVIDRGIGIVSSDVPRIFDRFRQIDASSTREHGGTGVGLYLCAQLVRVHDGRIWVDSSWGKGSTFSFSLPRRDRRSHVVQMQGKRVSSTEPAKGQAGEGSS